MGSKRCTYELEVYEVMKGDFSGYIFIYYFFFFQDVNFFYKFIHKKGDTLPYISKILIWRYAMLFLVVFYFLLACDSFVFWYSSVHLFCFAYCSEASVWVLDACCLLVFACWWCYMLFTEGGKIQSQKSTKFVVISVYPDK